MLSKPEHGWADVEIGDFRGRASYLTDVPNDCLDAFIYALANNAPTVIYFDAEGWEYYLVASYWNSYVITDKDSAEVYYSDLSYRALANELIDDIENNIDDWANWMCYRDFDDSELEQNKQVLEGKLQKIKMLLSS
mgnify:CR=1 FL=1